jgi:RNA polymerase sigma factor (TIGR02999 family)
LVGAAPAPEGVTELLLKWREGDDSAMDRLMPLVHGELRRLACGFLHHERPGHTLQATALVNEAYLRLVRSSRVQWRDRAHFFAVSAQLMRRVLIDEARKRGYQKRGGDATRVTLEETSAVADERPVDVLALDEALRRLAEHSPRKGRIVELRFFGGLTTEEIAEVLGVSVDIVKREWRTAKLWLMRMLNERGDEQRAMGSD